MSGRHTTGGPPDYEALQRDIRERQARIESTLGAIRERLNPRTEKEATMNRMSNRAYETTTSVTGAVRSNPLPVAMIGVGLGWLLLSQSGYGDRIAHGRAARRAAAAAHSAREGLHHAGEGVRHAAGSAYERASRSVRSAAERFRGEAHGAQERTLERYGTYVGGTGAGLSSARRRAGRAVTGFWDLVDDHPLVAGVMGVALGAALGASIPSSRIEDEWIGDYADDAYDRAREMAEDTAGRGSRAAQAAYQAAKEDLAEAVTDAKDAAREEMRKPA